MAKKIKKTYKELAIEFKKTKDEKVYNELYAKMRPGLWSYVNNIIKDPHVADDIVSTTLTTVYLKIEQYNEDYQITTWAYRIAYNECIGWIRYRNRRLGISVFTDKGIDPPMFMLPEINIDNSMAPTEADYWDTEHLLMERVRLTTEAIKALPPMYKRFMEERFLNKKSYNDILDIMLAYETGINLQTVKNRIFRGRIMVRKQLEKMKVFSEVLNT